MKIFETDWGACLYGIPKQTIRIVKLTILIMTLFLMQVSAATRAQITIREKKVTLQKVLEVISTQSGYDFVYSNTDFKDLKPVSITLNNASIEQALRVAFYGQPLIYEISDKTVMVKKKDSPSLIEKIGNYFASVDVHGRVVDENLDGISGVTITVKNKKGAWASGKDGSFFIKNLYENDVLIFSYMGYEKLEVELKGREDLGFIYMKVSTSKLDEVQVQGYGLTSRRISTSNITTVKAEDIAKQPVDNPLYALMGRVPGLIVTPTSGLYGAAVKVQLRGQNSLQNVESEPLYVIDGIPATNNMSRTYVSTVSVLSLINPNDIESIDVLKDADATAIYGSRGANGVILITTKKGKSGQASISARFNAGFSDLAKHVEMMNTQQYLEMRKEAYKNDGLPLPTVPEFNNYDLTVYDQNRYTDWQKEFLGGTAKNYMASISISGGTPNVQYLMGGNYNTMSYIFPGSSDYQLGMLHFNISGSSPDQRLKASLVASYTGNKSTAPYDLTFRAFSLAPNAPALYKENGEINWAPNPQSARGETTWQQSANPYAGFSNASKNNSNNIVTTLDLSYNIIKNLTAKVTSGFTRVGYKSFLPTTISSQDPANYQFNRGTVYLNDNVNNTWSVEPQLNYSNFLAGGKISAMVAGSLQGQELQDQVIYATGYTNDALLGSLNFSGFGNTFGQSSSSQYKYMAVFSRINYNYKDRYILNINARRDGSSRFGPGNQFGNFGSIGAAWIFTNENFLKDKNKILSYGKFRASFGVSGNDQIGDYRYLQTFEAISGGYASYQEVTPLQSSGPVNPNFHWESKKSIELGFDLGLFGERILLSGSYFRSRVGDQVLDQAIPSTAGGQSILVNDMAKIQNTGAEISLSTINIQSDSFKWTTSGNLSFLNRNKVLAFPGDVLPSRLAALYDGLPASVIGKPFAGVVAVYEYRGVDPDAGTYMFADRNGNTLRGTQAITADAYPFAKKLNIAPEYMGMLSNQFSYKGFSLDIALQFTKQLGRNYLYNFNNVTAGVFDGGGANLPIAFMDRWTKVGDQTDIQKFSQSSEPLVSYLTQMAKSDRAWVDASFIRVKNVALSYRFGPKILQRLKVKNLSLNMTAQNLFTITGYKGVDPEAQSLMVLPPLRTITAGISVEF